MFLIADIGINHNGSLDSVFKLIDLAKENDFNVVKFQKRTPRLCVPKDKWENEKISCFGTTTYIEYKELIEFNKLQYDAIDKYCKLKNISWTASVWDIPSLNFLIQYNIPFIKIPGEKLSDDELIKACISTNIPIIMSLGMNSIKDIKHALSFFPTNYNLKLLHCNNLYPCPLERNYLSMIPYFQNLFPQYEIGFSCHEEGLQATLMAINSGVKIIERHITLNKQAIGTDHKCSLDQKEMKILKQYIHLTKEIQGNPANYFSEIQGTIKDRDRKRDNNYIDNNFVNIYQTYYLENVYKILTNNQFHYCWIEAEHIKEDANPRKWFEQDYYLNKYKSDKIKLAQDILLNGTFTPFFGIQHVDKTFEICSGGHRIESLHLLPQSEIKRKFLFIYWDTSCERLCEPIQLYTISLPFNKIALQTFYTYHEVFINMDALFGSIDDIFPNNLAKPLEVFNDELIFEKFLQERILIPNE